MKREKNNLWSKTKLCFGDEGLLRKEKLVTDPHFHGGRTAPGSTETPALTQS